MKKAPAREARSWEVIAFRVSIETRKGVEVMRQAMGCSLGEFMRFLVRQELKGFRPPLAK